MLDNDDLIEILWFLKGVSVELRSVEKINENYFIGDVFMGSKTLIEFERKFDIMLDKLGRPDK